ncbi:XRE family transcriptional regulator [Sporosarcina sp. FSL W7-1349]|uniref:helix-turn-helix domain-containing protein n=1 Tax=Sporosarcina sp. FSL W7-1349 TaxID=2921561 RepID=UPI0030F8C5A2
MENVYKRIRELRVKAGKTLKELGEETNLTASFLSQVERGNSSLAIGSLKKIADALQVHISYFFDEMDDEQFVLDPETQERVKTNNLETEYIRLNGKFPQRSLAPFLLRLAPYQKKTQTFQYAGEEFYYVLKGAVIFTIDEKEHYVKQGQCIHFPAHLEHYGENPLNEVTELLAVVTPVIF